MLTTFTHSVSQSLRKIVELTQVYNLTSPSNSNSSSTTTLTSSAPSSSSPIIIKFGDGGDGRCEPINTTTITMTSMLNDTAVHAHSHSRSPNAHQIPNNLLLSEYPLDHSSSSSSLFAYLSDDDDAGDENEDVISSNESSLSPSSVSSSIPTYSTRRHFQTSPTTSENSENSGHLSIISLSQFLSGEDLNSNSAGYRSSLSTSDDDLSQSSNISTNRSSNEVITVESDDEDAVEVLQPPPKRPRISPPSFTNSQPPRNMNTSIHLSFSSSSSSSAFHAAENSNREISLVEDEVLSPDEGDDEILEVVSKDNDLIDLTTEQYSTNSELPFIASTYLPPSYSSSSTYPSSSSSSTSFASMYYNNFFPPYFPQTSAIAIPLEYSSSISSLDVEPRNTTSALRPAPYPRNVTITVPNPSPSIPNEIDSPDSNIGAKLTCTICVEKTTEPASTKCGHVFCLPCIKKTISLFRQCPTCRRKLSAKDVHRIYI